MASYKNFYDKHKQLIPLIILFGFCLQLLITAFKGSVEMEGNNYPFVLTAKHYYAFAAVVINALIYFTFRRSYIYLLMLTLLLGIFGILGFTSLDTQTSYSFGSIVLSIEPTCFYLLLLVGVLNIDKFRKPKQTSPEQENKNFNYKSAKEEIEIEKYKKLYIGKSTEDLEKILAEKQIRETARLALQQTLEERRHPKTK